MSNLELAMNIISSLSEDKLVAFIRLFADENVIARMESEALANNPTATRYATVDEAFEELDKDV